MVELTTREKLIIHLMYTLLNPHLQHESFEKKKNALYGVLALNGIQTNDDELLDLTNAVKGLMNDGQGKALAILSKHGFNLKGLKL